MSIGLPKVSCHFQSSLVSHTSRAVPGTTFNLYLIFAESFAEGFLLRFGLTASLPILTVALYIDEVVSKRDSI